MDVLTFLGVILASGVVGWIAGVGLFTLLGGIGYLILRVSSFISYEMEYAWVRWRSRWRG